MAASASARKPTHRLLPVDPEHYRRLEDASFDLPAKLRRKLGPADVFALFMGDEFEAWLERVLASRDGGKNTR